MIAVVAAFAIGAQRILPALQLAYASYSLIRVSNESFKDVLDLLEQPVPNESNQESNQSISFESTIELQNVSFRYSIDSPWIFKNINLEIKKGDHVGFIGPTGSGKSTLIDILLGLLLPSEGRLVIDGIQIDETNRSLWQKNISHVPQVIVLSDNSVEENIAFATHKSDISSKKVFKAAKKAQLSKLIESWPEKYQTMIGENGVKISGGQRQRIGIARALYNESKILFFDEATSALDNQTEKNFMKSLNELDEDLTLLMIAHRLTTLKNCNKIIELDVSDGLKETQYDKIIQ
jgi:ATP-binding cassette subfamily B protein